MLRLGAGLGPFQEQNLRFGGLVWASGRTDGQTGFSSSLIEIDGFERFWRQKLRFWRRRCAPPKNPDPRTERVQNGVSRVTRKPTSDSWRVSGLLFFFQIGPSEGVFDNLHFM